MRKITFIIKFTLLFNIFCQLDLFSQTIYTYDFGTSVSSYTVAGSSNNIITAPSGNAYIYIASSPNGGGHIKNPGLVTFGSGSKLMLHSSSSGGSVNKFSIWGYSGGTTSYSKFSVVLADSIGGNTPVSGTFYFCTGTGTSFQNNNGLSPGEILSGLKWTVANNGTIGTKTIKTGNSWRDITLNPFYQGQTNVYTIEVFGNNSISNINYNYNFVSNSIPPLKQDIYINGVLCADDFDVSGNGLAQGSSVDCLMFYVEENSASRLCAFIDNVSYQSSISPNIQTYIDYYSKPAGNVNLLTNWTTNQDGSGSDNPPNFSGGTSGTSTMNFNLTNRSSATIDANWNISGQNCKLIIGNGNTSCTLSVPNSYSFTAPQVTVSNLGVLSLSNPSCSVASMNVLSGGTYIHNTNGSVIPTANWSINSSCIVSGVTSTAPSGFGQNFYNLIWNNASQSQNINLSLPSGFSISGDLTIQNTGGVSGRTLQLISNTSRTNVISGNLNLTGGHLALSSGNGVMNLSVNGNTSLSSGSELYLSQSGSANSNLSLSGNLSLAAGTIITDNGSAPGNTVVFAKNGTQNLYINGTFNNINYTINSGSTLIIDNDLFISPGRSLNINGTLYFWNYLLNGGGNFTLGSGGTIGIGNQGGIALTGSTGNIQNTGSRTYSTSANYVYNGSTAQFTGNGLPANVNNFIIDNTSGVALGSDLTVNGVIMLVNGILDIGNYNTVLSTAGSLSGYSSTAYFKTSGTGTLKRRVSSGNITFPVGYNTYTPVVINNTGTADNFTVRVKNSIDNPVINDHIVNKQWMVNEETPGGSNAVLTVTWNSGDENINFDRNGNVYLGNWNGTAWETYFGGYGFSGTGPYSVSASGLTTFGNFLIGNSGALPVELEYFYSYTKGNSVKLNWKTSSEINNAGFEVYRKISESGSQWIKLGFITGNGTVSTGSEYFFIDEHLTSGKFEYKLKQLDLNGNFENFSLNNIVEIGKPAVTEISQNYPNPFNPLTKIDYYLAEDGFIKITLYDMLGKEVSAILNDYKKSGYYSLEFNGSELASGIYFYRIITGKFSAIKKMIIVK